jgi:putative addiction module component (TIGR02574 family)
MTTQTAELIDMVESLPIDMKAMLVEKLLHSMYPNQKDIDELWKIEAERRIEEIRSGKVTPIPGDQVFTEIQERFGK